MPQSIYSADISESESSKTKKQTYSGTRYRWNSHWDFILYAIICSTSTNGFSLMTKHTANIHDGTIIQFLLTYIIFGIPVVYMQVVLGQYTQMGIIFFKHLAPIGHGLTYSFTLNLCLRSIERGILIGEYIAYLLTSIRTDLQWLICPTPVGCWAKNSTCTYNCLANANISAYVYYMQKYLDNPVTDIKDTKFTLPAFQKVTPMVIGWGITVTTLIFAISNYNKVMRTLTYIALILMVLLFFGAFSTNGGFYFFQEMIKLDPKSCFSIEAWGASVHGAVGLLALGRPFHVVNGSYLAPSASSGILIVVAVTLNFLWTLCHTIISFACYGIIKSYSFTDNAYITKLPTTRSYITMAVIPQALSLMGVEQFWSALYFLYAIVIQSNNQILHLMAIENCLCDANPQMLRYRKYLLSFLCFFCFATGLFLISRDMYALMVVYIQANYAAALVNITITAILVTWIYGVQRLCDDIHYMSGSQPSKFWKLCWYITPVIVIITFIGQSIIGVISKGASAAFTWSYLLLLLLFTSPITIYSIIETFMYIKKRNLLGLFKPTEAFGPPDEEDRRLRQMYNPRTEIKSRRRTDKCQHRCLLNNKYLQQLIHEEICDSVASVGAVRSSVETIESTT